MIFALGHFVEQLREEGVKVSPAELLDASRALERVGLTERVRFKAALRTTLAKSHRHREVFERVFDRFFVPPRREPRGKGEQPGGGPGEGTKRREAASVGARGERSRRRDEPVPGVSARVGQTPRRDREAEASSRDRLRALVQDVRNARRLGRLRIVRLESEPAGSASRREERSAGGRSERRDLARPMSADEEAELARLVPKLVQEIRLKSGRRLRASRQGRLHTRRLLRDNLAYGGIPFLLPFRRSRPRRPRVVLLVDVSFSVARSAGFFLTLASEFLRIGRSARVVAFVDRPVDATESIRKWIGRTRGEAAPVTEPAGRARRHNRRRPGEGIRHHGISFADVLDSLRGLNLDAPSDYGRAFHGVLGSQLRPSGRDTILVILGDARTNRFDPLPWALEEISRRCRHVLWLVSEPDERWGTGDSALASYLPWVDVAVEANDLAGLTRGLAELVRKL